MADTIYPLMLIPGAIPLLVDLFSWIQGEIADIPTLYLSSHLSFYFK